MCIPMPRRTVNGSTMFCSCQTLELLDCYIPRPLSCGTSNATGVLRHNSRRFFYSNIFVVTIQLTYSLYRTHTYSLFLRNTIPGQHRRLFKLYGRAVHPPKVVLLTPYRPTISLDHHFFLFLFCSMAHRYFFTHWRHADECRILRWSL
jgi:hypothetical protein